LAKQPISKHLAAGRKCRLDKYFKAVINMQASDLHLKGGELPRVQIRIYGGFGDS